VLFPNKDGYSLQRDKNRILKKLLTSHVLTDIFINKEY
jgi:hypothetical protein